MAKLFNKETADKPGFTPIFYNPGFQYHFYEEDFKGLRYFYGEPLLPLKQKEDFEIYSNNGEFCKDPFLGSFSHYTYMKSSRSFIITDL